MKLYACGIMAAKREPVPGASKVTTSLSVCHVEANSEDEASGKAHHLALFLYPRDIWTEGYSVLISDDVCEMVADATPEPEGKVSLSGR